MRDVAVETALAEDQWMPRRAKSHYAPPKNPGSVMLSAALEGSGRFPENKQLKLVGNPKDPGDMRLYYAGDLSLLKRPAVAVVGTREVSDAGMRRTQRLARGLVDAGIVVVSGLAYGVDAAAHTTTLEHGGKTIAVIGTPLNKASPSENAPLQERIYQDHLLISQFREGGTTHRSNFPARNKLMATLTDATVVMEARDGSGTLHQAAECTRLGRWLFIAKSVAGDASLKWPRDFLKYDTCVVLEDVSQITDRVLKSCS